MNFKRYIFFSDLHCNFCALNQLFEYLLKLEGKTKVFFLGDLVGYYQYDQRIIEIFIKMLSQFHLTTILGNHDAKFLNTYFNTFYKVNCEIPFYEEFHNESVRSNIRDILEQAKISEEVNLFNKRTKISHGGIDDPLNDYYYPDLKFLYNLKKSDSDIDYIFGHTHHPFIYKDTIKNIRYFNVGSLGMPRNGEVCGSFLEITSEYQEIKKIQYDLDLHYEANNDLPNKIKNRVYFGGNSKFINNQLLNFNKLELDLFKSKIIANTMYFKRLILIHNTVKILKVGDGYVFINSNREEKCKDLDSLIKVINYEKI